MAPTDVSPINGSRTRIILLALMILLINFYYYSTVPGHIYYHTLFRNLYFLPLILAGIWFGLRGAIIVSLAITALYAPFIVTNWQGFSATDFSRLLEILVFDGAAVVLGLITEREKRTQKNLRESESLAVMGKALSATAHDMKSPLIAIGGIARLVHKRLKEDDESRERLAMVI
jgi:two-component system, NtrC family, sensor histidine kinase HydH